MYIIHIITRNWQQNRIYQQKSARYSSRNWVSELNEQHLL